MNAEFGLKKSFHIDNGELDGETPQQCFVLGYELAQVDAAAICGDGFARPVHSQNADRIRESLRDAGRTFSLTFMPEDLSESWMWLVVKPRDQK